MGKLSDYQLEQLAHGGKGAALESLDPEDQARLTSLQRSNDEILAELPPAKVAAEVHRRAAMPRDRFDPWLAYLAGAAIAACIAAVFYVIPRGAPLGSDTTQDVTQIKGLEPRVSVYRQTTGEPEELRQDALVNAGDVLQLRYQAAGLAYGAIVSIDGRGGVTLHLPEHDTDVPVLSAASAALPHAYQLDDAPGFERFFFVASGEPFDVRQVLAAARVLAKAPARAEREPLALHPTLRQSSLRVRKGAK